ncbi:hypothetical protein Ctob_016402, partial [Chrysochromulina tobinii]
VHATETLQISRRSHGRLTCCLLLAGRWCLRRFWQGHDNVFLDLREYSLRWRRCLCRCVPAVTITSSLITGNTASSGGGVYVQSGRVTITSSSIYGNTADRGGGVYVYSGTVTITSSSIHGNSAVYQWVRATETLQFSHRPDGRLTF